MADEFEFDAPHYADLTNPEQCDPSGIDKSYFAAAITSCESLDSSKTTSDKIKEQMSQLSCSSVASPNEMDNESCKSNVRQSPRLAVLAMDMLSKKLAKPVRNHRRSLSEGASIPSNLSKVKKASLIKRSSPRSSAKATLSHDDIKNLQSIASISNDHCQKLRSTRPKEFHFATDARVKTQDNNNRDDDLVKDFAKTLRSDNYNKNSNDLKEHRRGPTKIKTFNLHEPKKLKEGSQPFVSMAELNMKFESQTPLRFRTKRSGSAEPVVDLLKKTRNEFGFTIPHTPQLSTRSRSRQGPHYPTIEEIEAKELEEAHKKKFKANPLDKKIFEQPKQALKEKKKHVTVPEPFDITDSKKQASGDIGRNLFAACRSIAGSTMSLASIPHGGIAAIWDKKSTQPKPFSFDARDSEMLAQKKQKITKVLEEEKKAAEFHAQLMPIFENGPKGLPIKKPPSPTVVKPFNLRSDIRGMVKQEQIHKQLEELNKLEEEQRKFHAQSDNVVHKQPFIPEKSKKPLTDISGFSLNTEKRAEERLSFDMQQKQKEDEILAKKRQAEERRQAEEEAEVARLRKEVVHKAKPVPQYKPFQIKTGLLPPTVPVSPEFETNKRIRTRSTSSSQQNLSLNSSSCLNGTFNMDQQYQ